MKEYIEYLIKNLDCLLYGDNFIPIYQIIMALVFGLFWGPFHYAFIWTLISYSAFEYLLRLCLSKRPWLYVWQYRIVALIFAFVGIIFSKYIWGNRPLFRILI